MSSKKIKRKTSAKVSAKKKRVNILTSKCVESTCKNPDETYLIFSPLFISYGLNLYLLKKARSEKPLYERYMFNPIIKIITEFT